MLTFPEPITPLSSFKTEEEKVREQLHLTGLMEGMTAVDISEDSFLTSKVMTEMVGPKGKVLSPTLKRGKSSLHALKLENECADYVFSRFIFQAAPQPLKVFEEFVRVTKPKGKIVVGDLDCHSMIHYPLAPYLESQLLTLMQELHQKGIEDPWAGRRLYSYFVENQMHDVRVHIVNQQVSYGENAATDLEYWTKKLKQIDNCLQKKLISLPFDLESFKNEFLAFFQNPTRLSYSPFILVEGIKP